MARKSKYPRRVNVSLSEYVYMLLCQVADSNGVEPGVQARIFLMHELGKADMSVMYEPQIEQGDLLKGNNDA